MGNCKFCDKDAGFLRGQHKACKQRADAKRDEIRRLVTHIAIEGGDLVGLTSQIRLLAVEGLLSVSDDELREVVTTGWTNGVIHATFGLSLDETAGYGEDSGKTFAIDSGRLRIPCPTDSQVANLNLYRRHFGLSSDELDKDVSGSVMTGSFTMFRQALVIKLLLDEGKAHAFDRSRYERKFGRLPIRLMKSESLIWVFNSVKYYRATTSREFRGGSTGISIRVAKGVYLRQSGFRGEAVETVSMKHQDAGVLAVTTKHVYFSGSNTSFRIRLERIVSTKPCKEGIVVMRDLANAKQELFALGNYSDIWFAMSLMDALAEIEGEALEISNDASLEMLLNAGNHDADQLIGPSVVGFSE